MRDTSVLLHAKLPPLDRNRRVQVSFRHRGTIPRRRFGRDRTLSSPWRGVARRPRCETRHAGITAYWPVQGKIVLRGGDAQRPRLAYAGAPPLLHIR